MITKQDIRDAIVRLEMARSIIEMCLTTQPSFAYESDVWHDIKRAEDALIDARLKLQSTLGE